MKRPGSPRSSSAHMADDRTDILGALEQYKRHNKQLKPAKPPAGKHGNFGNDADDFGDNNRTLLSSSLNEMILSADNNYDHDHDDHDHDRNHNQTHVPQSHQHHHQFGEYTEGEEVLATRTCVTCHLTENCPHDESKFVRDHRTCIHCGLSPFGMMLKRSVPTAVVYNRNLKMGKGRNTAPLIIVGRDRRDRRDWTSIVTGFYVEVELLVDGTYEALNNACLSGTKKYPVEFGDIKQDTGKSCVFSDLKITVTSKQVKETKNGEQVKDNAYVLQWSFYATKPDGKIILLACVRTDPFLVHSHSEQIRKNNGPQTLPKATKLCPTQGNLTIAAEHALHGENFFPGTCVKLGGTGDVNGGSVDPIGYIVAMNVHNSGAGTFMLTDDMLEKIRGCFEDAEELRLPISLCNDDNKTWVVTPLAITFANEAMLAQRLLSNGCEFQEENNFQYTYE